MNIYIVVHFLCFLFTLNRKISIDGYLKFVAAIIERGAAYNPEPFEVAFHHLGPTFINANIVSE